jgi:hypothetical protein
MRREFPVHLDRRRALIARLISAVTRKLSARAPGRSLATPCLQALRLGIAYNIYRLRFFACLGTRRMSTEPHTLKDGYIRKTLQYEITYLRENHHLLGEQTTGVARGSLPHWTCPTPCSSCECLGMNRPSSAHDDRPSCQCL